ncbi:hypothetical protein Q9Q95_11450 [Sphingomonas sp. DG1-23]|uniref:hypothetical protein n=1 Tax=Sphingomonas sp. DG1-23 TaxID=3068316 RepID=UPI00273D761F|nr:hypothetical protein [Sphingomonas sp. DG1-23]MDP5279539.1 hypothetical protein [Sphingomonas sp. DG1-23]
MLPTTFPKLYEGLKGSPSAIGRDLRRFSAADGRANIIAHEGQHGIDMRAAGGYILDPEPSAYATGRLVNKGLGSVSIHDIPVKNK